MTPYQQATEREYSKIETLAHQLVSCLKGGEEALYVAVLRRGAYMLEEQEGLRQREPRGIRNVRAPCLERRG